MEEVWFSMCALIINRPRKVFTNPKAAAIDQYTSTPQPLNPSGLGARNVITKIENGIAHEIMNK